MKSFLLLAAAFLAVTCHAAGVIRGRVFNPATGEYVKNAEITVQGTNLSAISQDGGSYALSGVPEGTVTLTATFAGYQPAQAIVTVGPGQDVGHDFNLTSTEVAAGETINLARFVVASQREGNAKAIMEQRNSMNIGSVVASDVFGEVSEGNLGEFLKYLPGVELEYVGDDARTPRLQGMGTQYSGVTMDGMSIASADGNVFSGGTTNTAAGQRSFGLDSVSINSIDSVEVNYVTGADQDANAPAGTINMRTKRAFERKGRRISYQLYGAFNSREDSFHGFIGGDDSHHSSFRPGGRLELSDVFLGNRLGIVVGVVESNIASFNSRHTIAYNNVPTAADPRPFVVSNLTMLNTRKLTRRNTVTLTADYKFSERFAAGLTLIHNHYRAPFENQQQAFAGARNVNRGGDGFTNFDIAGTGTLTLTAGPGDKVTRSYTAIPRFDFKAGALELTALLSYSYAENHYGHGTASATVAALGGLSYQVQRSDAASAAWHITQTGGPDWSDLGRYVNPRVAFRDSQNEQDIYSAKLDAKRAFAWNWPTILKVGGKITESYQRMDDRGPLRNYAYIGPGGGATGSFAAWPAPWTWTDFNGSTALSLSGRTAPHPNATAIAGMFFQHPEYFNSTTTAAQWFNANIANHVKVKEAISAAYGQAETKISGVRVQAGLRWENTRLTAHEYDQLPASQVRAAGFPLDANRRPTTIPGFQYAYLSRPQVKRTGEYDYFFPSATANYKFTPNLVGQLGWNRTIARPAYTDMAGAWDWQDASSNVTVPNPELKPERGEKFMGRLAYYFEPVGQLSVSAYQNNLTNAIEQREGSAADFGYGGEPGYASYDFLFKSNVPGVTRTKGYSVDYSQVLSFLPKPLASTMVFANYARAYASRRLAGLPPHMISGGVTLRLGRLAVSPNVKWIAETPSEFTAGVVRKETLRLDFNADFRLLRHANLFVTAKNVFDEPDAFYREDTPAKLYRYNTTGAYWTVGVKGTF
ncbi:MAG TPA: outer membrane beta-barrel protein [Opitutaceae bacterium]|nr:outer membrane beta-barrel protein [Opitutaceae bacterium]